MGFLKPDLEAAYSSIRKSIAEINSPYNDGYTGSYCKHELYQLKSWLDDQYQHLPKFADETEWEQKRIMSILKDQKK